jgi:hypothetical protein
MFLVIALLNRVDAPEKAIQRFRELGLPDPVLVRARSAAAALSAEVPVFAGLRSLALGADEDRLVGLALWDAAQPEVERVLARVQLEMDADDPPMGQVVALPVLAPERSRRPG